MQSESESGLDSSGDDLSFIDSAISDKSFDSDFTKVSSEQTTAAYSKITVAESGETTDAISAQDDLSNISEVGSDLRFDSEDLDGIKTNDLPNLSSILDSSNSNSDQSKPKVKPHKKIEDVVPNSEVSLPKLDSGIKQVQLPNSNANKKQGKKPKNGDNKENKNDDSVQLLPNSDLTDVSLNGDSDVSGYVSNQSDKANPKKGGNKVNQPSNSASVDDSKIIKIEKLLEKFKEKVLNGKSA